MNNMNQYTLNQLKEGMNERFEVKITQDMIDKFCEISGDVNSLHRDSDYAKKQGYQDCVSYGMLTASFYSTLVGVYLPGKYCMLKEISTKFLRPVFCGDILTVEGTVVEVHDVLKHITIKAQITNQDGKKVSRAMISTGLLPEVNENDK